MSGYCVICTETFSTSSEDISAPLCGHTFHRHCLDGWLAKSKTCPQCRLPVSPKGGVIPKLFFDASPDPEDDPEVLKFNNAQLSSQLRHRDNQVAYLQTAVDAREVIMRDLRRDIVAHETSLSAERSVVRKLECQLEELTASKNQAIDQLQNQLKAVQKSLHNAQEQTKCYDDFLYGSSGDILPSMDMGDNTGRDSATGLQSYSILNLSPTKTNDSTLNTNSFRSDQIKMHTTNVPEKDVTPILADEDACNIYTAYQLSSMAANLNLLAQAEQDLERLFGDKSKETKANTKSSSAKRDGSSEENAIVID